jgi:L-ascorbate 6-phosphate lactonase
MPIHSDWNDWLPREIATTDPDDLAVWYLGCNGFALKGYEGTTVFIDPYLGIGDPPRTIRMIPVPFEPDDIRRADAIFTTHGHVDHTHGPSQAPILASTGATLYGPDDAVAVACEMENWTTEYGVDCDQLVGVCEAETIEVGEFTVHVTPANDPDASHPVTYVIEHETMTFFHGGDSKPADAFTEIGRSYNIDLGVLAFGTVGIMPHRETGEATRTRWYNDENQIVEAAEALQLDSLLPSHWDMWKRLTADPTVLHHHIRSFDYPRNLEIAEIGDRII